MSDYNFDNIKFANLLRKFPAIDINGVSMQRKL